MKFELIQDGEFDEYYYEIVSDDNECDGVIMYDFNRWVLDKIYYKRVLEYDELIQVANKINELNAATKADKLFGFL